MLFTFPGAAEFDSGVILQDETIRQKCAVGTSMAGVLSQQEMLPGIKVHSGARPLAGCPGETVTEELDGLRDQLAEYRELGTARKQPEHGSGEPRSSATVSPEWNHALAQSAAANWTG